MSLDSSAFRILCKLYRGVLQRACSLNTLQTLPCATTHSPKTLKTLCEQPRLLDQLEPRLLLHGDTDPSYFAQFGGAIDQAGIYNEHAMMVSPEAFDLTASKVILAFEVTATDGSVLDPSGTTIVDGSGTTITPMFMAPNLGGISKSLILAEVPKGDYTLKITGENGTIGGYTLDVGLVGDTNGDQTVDITDLTVLRDSLVAGTVSPVTDLNADGRVSASDYAMARRNFGVSHEVTDLTLTVDTDPAAIEIIDGDTYRVGTDQIALTGSTTPGAVVIVTGPGGIDESVAANGSGQYTIDLDLPAGLTPLSVTTQDPFGQTLTQNISTLYQPNTILIDTDYTTAEGFVAGNLNGQQGFWGQNGPAVNPAGSGTVSNTGQGYLRNAFNTGITASAGITSFNTGDMLELVVNYQFQVPSGGFNGTAGSFGFKDDINNVGSLTPEFGFSLTYDSNNGGRVQVISGSNTQTFGDSAFGMSSSDNVSDDMRFTYILTSNGSNTYTVTDFSMQNLRTNVVTSLPTGDNDTFIGDFFYTQGLALNGNSGFIGTSDAVSVTYVVNNNAEPTGGVTIAGTPLEGETLTASNNITDANGIIGAINYQWQRGTNNIPGATGAAYTLTEDDVASNIRVVAWYTDNGGTFETVPSASIGPVIAVQTGVTSAIQNGAWHDALTWSNGVPDATKRAIITSGRTVTLSGINHVAEQIVVHGVLDVEETAGVTRTLTTDWMHVNSGGVFQIGTEANRYDQGEFIMNLIGTDQTADYTIETAMGSMQITDNDGFLMAAMNGRLQFFGEEKLSFTKLSQTANAGTNQIVVENIIERNFDGTTSVASDGALNWEVGDQIVIASSSRDYDDEEVRTITAITDLGNGTSRLTLNASLSNRHYGVIETYDNGNRSIDMRAEVALLNRNVKVQGLASQDTDSSFGNRAWFNSGNTGNNRGVGGHIMVMGTAGQISVEGIQLDLLGQTGTLGRYPIHWHIAGDRSGDILRGVSITNSNNRGVTIHGTHNVLIQDVVLHDIHGHGFFMEDAVETGNIYLSNIAYGIHKVGRTGTTSPNLNDPFIVDTHDHVGQNPTRFLSSAAYWMTNPDNTWIGNISAGSEGTGFWFLFPDSAIGFSAQDPQYNNVRPDRTNLGTFDYNTTHSSPIGLNVDRGSDIEVPLGGSIKANWDGDEHRPSVEPQFNNFTAYKHNVGIYHRGRTANFHENRFADNFSSTFITFTQRITDSLYVGHSQGNANYSDIVTGHTFYDGPNTLDGNHFAGFARSNAHTYRSAFVAVRNTHFMMSNTSFENDGSHDHVSTRVNPSGTTNIAPVGKGQPSIIYDVDGSITSSRGGGAGFTVVPDHPFYYDSNDIKPAGWNSRISDDPYATFRIYGANNPLLRITTPDGDSDDERTGSSSGFGINAVLKTNPTGTTQTDAGDYKISFPQGYTGNLTVQYTTKLGPLGWTMMEFTNQSTNRVTNRPFVSNLATLRNATQTSWTRSGSSIWVKFFSARNNNTTVFRPVALQAAALASEDNEAVATPSITNTQVNGLLDDATAYWAGRGFNTDLFADLNFEIKDLGGNLLGLQGGNTIFLDDDAAGYGWYVDADPMTNESFTGMDLFTTLTHEMGHALGLSDLYDTEDDDDLMFGFLSSGERRATFTV